VLDKFEAARIASNKNYEKRRSNNGFVYFQTSRFTKNLAASKDGVRVQEHLITGLQQLMPRFVF